MATPPRQIKKHTTYFITCRCVGRTFRLVPTDKVTKLVEYCLALCASLTGIQLHAYCFMSNHYHLVLTDVRGVLPDFMMRLNSLLSRNLNAMRGWNGTNFEKGYSAIEATDVRAAIERCAYTLANPVTADLVVRARGWKGCTSARMTFGQQRVIKRPKLGIWRHVARSERKRKRKKAWAKGRERHKGRTSLPETVELKLEPIPLPWGGSDEEMLQAVRDQVEEREFAAEKKRAAEGRTVMGMRRVQEQRWWDFPHSPEEMFGEVPRVAANDRWREMQAKQRCRVFEAEYQRVLEMVRSGVRAAFPEGTWLMVRRYGYGSA